MNELKDLNNGFVFKTLLIFSIPFIFSIALQSLYGMVDMLVVGQFVGKNGLSAVSISSQVIQLMTFICIALSTAGQICISQFVGSKKYSNIKETVGTMTVMMIVSSIVMMIIILLFNNKILALINTPKECQKLAFSYLVCCGAGMIFTGLYNMIAAILRGLGDSKHPLYFVIVASVVNIILDVLLVCYLDFGVLGAAFATVIGQAASVVFSIIFLYRHQKQFYISFDSNIFHVDSTILKTLLKLGIPLALQSSAITVSSLFVNGLVNNLGVAASATYGVGQKIMSIPSIFTQSVGFGVSTMCGQALGAKNLKRVQEVVNSGLILSGIAGIILAIIFYNFPKNIFSLFTNDQAVLNYSFIYMRSLCVQLPAMCIMSPCNNLINATGNTKLSFALGIMDGFIARIILSYLLGITFNYGAEGFFIGYSLAAYFTAIPGLIYYLSGLWKKRKILLS